MKILVTGGAGFIGSHVIEQLLKLDYEVAVLDNLSTGCRDHVPEEIPLYECDICSAEATEIMAREKFTAVIHLAAQTSVPESIMDPLKDGTVNIQGTLNILEACRKTGVKRLVFASSAAVYGDAEDLPLTEEIVSNPTSFYGLSKQTVEKYLELYWQNYGFSSVVLRFANVYGERQGDGGEGGVVSIFVRKLYRQECLTIYGDGGQTRDFVYVGDVARAIVQAVKADVGYGLYNVSTETEISVNELVQVLSNAAQKKPQIKYGPKREGDIYRSILRNQQAQVNLNWQPEISLKEGLKRTYADLSRSGGLK